MKDRIPGNPGRVLITPENGASYYATIVRADNPLQEGDALNKLNLLPDNVAELLGLDPKLNPVPATAFEKIGEKIKNVLGLNFTVYGGTSVPETAGEGDIWVNTDTPITSWAYSPKEPENPTEGKIWLKGGGAISFVIDTGTNGNIKIFPGSAAQYIGGTWVDKTAKSYQDGKWVEWVTFLYNSGDECESLTGGWAGAKIANTNSSISTYHEITVTRNEKSITANLGATGNTPHSNVFKTVEAIDLTKIKTIKANIEGNTEHMYNYLNFITYPVGATALGNGGENTSACLRLGNEGDYSIPLGDYSLDVSALSGEHYVGFFLYNTGGSTTLEVTVNKLWME